MTAEGGERNGSGGPTAAVPVAPDPLSALQDLLAAVPGNESQVLARLGPPDEGAPETALDFLFGRLRATFDDGVAQVREEWGEPHFTGTVEADDFPPWSDALVLAIWWHDETVAYLALRQEDDIDPLTLEAGALTQEELEQLQSWQPAAPPADG